MTTHPVRLHFDTIGIVYPAVIYAVDRLPAIEAGDVKEDVYWNVVGAVGSLVEHAVQEELG